MMYCKNLLRRFNGSPKAIEDYCQERSLDPTDLNRCYMAAGERVVYNGSVRYIRPQEPAFHKMGAK